jgi:hypothetical protein
MSITDSQFVFWRFSFQRYTNGRYTQVSRMLDQNLISSFHRSKEFAAAQVERAAAVNNNSAGASADSERHTAASSAADLADEFDK